MFGLRRIERSDLVDECANLRSHARIVPCPRVVLDTVIDTVTGTVISRDGDPGLHDGAWTLRTVVDHVPGRSLAMDLNHLNLRVRNAAACRDFYERHFGFRPAFEAEGGYFVRNDEGFLLALVPAVEHQPLPAGFHIGFRVAAPADVESVHADLSESGVAVSDLEDDRPDSEYVTFRCWDPDGTEVEVFWEPAPE